MNRPSSFALILLASCLCSVPYPGSLAETRKMMAGQFPTGVGSRWVYVVHDSSAGRTDTLHVRIVGTTEFPGGRRARVWQYRTGSTIDTQYTVRTGDTLAFYAAKSPESVTAVFIFPLIPGESRTVVPPGTMTVKRIVTASVPAGKFYHALEVRVRPAVQNSAGGTTYTLAPGMGIVRLHRAFLNTLTDRQEAVLWELLSGKPNR